MKTDIPLKEIEIHGYCDPRFASVKEAFADNFRHGGDVGASFAATIDGKFIIDIWAGYADAGRTRPWNRDTLACLYSTTKTMTALSALVLVDRGQLDLDAPVEQYLTRWHGAVANRNVVPLLLEGLRSWNTAVTTQPGSRW